MTLPPLQAWSIWVLFVELLDHFWAMLKVFLPFPRVASFVISFPLDQELDFSSTHLGIKDPLNFIFYMIVNDLRRGWKRSLL